MGKTKYGPYAFIVGIVIALLAGLAVAFGMISVTGNLAGIVGLVLVVLGLIVGFMNVSDKETVPFLVAAIALMATSAVAGWAYMNAFLNIGTIISSILGYVGVFVAPAAVIVAIKAVWSLAKD